MENLEQLVSSENQVKVVRLQDKLGQQNIHEDIKKTFELVTKSIKDVPEEVTKTATENSIKSNQAIENLNKKLLEILNDRGILDTYLMSTLSKITNPESSSHFELIKDSNSKRVIDLEINKTKPITLHDNLLTFRHAGREFELQGDLLEMITNKIYKADVASLSDKKLLYDLAEEMNLDLKAEGNKSTRDRTLTKLLKSPGLMVSASSVSKTFF